MPLIAPRPPQLLGALVDSLGVTAALPGLVVAAVVVLELADGRVFVAPSADLSPAHQLGLMNAAWVKSAEQATE